MRQHNSGFTLIELLVVISIIGILAALLLANMVGIRQRAADTKIKSDLNQIKTALRLYYNDNQSYPGGTPGNTCSGLAGYLSNSSPFYVEQSIFPLTNCEYYRGAGGDSFVIGALLNNTQDPSVDETQGCASIHAFDEGYYLVCSK